MQGKKEKLDISSENKQNIFFYIIFAFILIYGTYLVFSGLNSSIVYDWDEARHGINAYEMMKSKTYIVNTFDGQEDMWNLKPPLSMWMIILGYKIFGINTLGMRFFSALSLVIIIAISMIFIKKRIGIVAAITTGILFAGSSRRFYHLFRTGDPDALFFLCCFLCCIFLYLSYKKSSNYLIGAGLFTSFAFLLKASHVVILFILIILTIILLKKEKIFTIKDILLKLLLPMAVPTLIWMVLRFSHDGMDFFINMIEVDILNRLNTVVESHDGGWGFYISVLFTLLGEWWDIGVFVVLIGFLFVKLMSREKVSIDKTFITISCLMFLIPMILFSVPKTKLGWYIFPSLIGFYFIIGYVAENIYRYIKKNNKNRFINNQVVMTIILIPIIMGMFIYPRENIDLRLSSNSEYNIFLQTVSKNNNTSQQFNGYYSFNAHGEKIDLPQSWILHGIYLGIDHMADEEKIEEIKSDDKKLIVIQYTSPEELEKFQKINSQLSLVGTNEEGFSVFKF